MSICMLNMLSSLNKDIIIIILLLLYHLSKQK